MNELAISSTTREAVLLTVVYDTGMDDRMTGALTDLGVVGWTKLFGGHGSGGLGLKENTAVFPGTVNMLYIVLPAERLAAVVNAVRALQDSYRRNPGITLWSQPVCLHEHVKETT